MNTFLDVLCNQARWSIEQADVLKWARELPPDCIDTLICSPPYENRRTYGIGFKLIGQHWVNWMVKIVQAIAPAVKGPIFINCEGKTDDYSYSAVPFLLLADLKRLGFTVRKPLIYHRVGVPGSGATDWLRNDWEPILCITRPGKLPYANQTACGHPPKWAPGGEMSNRLTDGTRRNQWGASPNGSKVRQENGKREDGRRPSHVVKAIGDAEGIGGGLFDESKKPGRKKHTKTKEGGKVDQTYTVPDLANPGNTIQETYTADEVASLLEIGSDVLHAVVGGGSMGSKFAHGNEAPFSEALPKFLIKTFCPENGVVCDPFSGSGTTAAVSVKFGRRFIGCDLRQEMVDLGHKRMLNEATGLFDEVQNG